MNSGILRNAVICDGTGRAPYPADLRFDSGRITAIGEIAPANLPEYQAEGCLLTPGFIDPHAHSDLSLAAAPEAFGKLSQGITTEISGNCGLSAFPVLTGEVREHLNLIYRKYDVPITWSTLKEYAAELERRDPAVNFVMLCGGNTLRANLLGYEARECPPQIAEKLRNLLAENLREGAAGLSTGLLYVPGKFASAGELAVMASALRGTNKVHATHLRSEGDRLLESLEEAIAISKAGDSMLQVSHIKTALPRNHHKIGALLERIHQAQSEGMQIHADRYPYTWSQTSLSVVLPPPWDVMSDAAVLESLRGNPERRKELERKLLDQSPAWERILLCSTAVPEVSAFSGQPFLKIAEKLHRSPAELCTALMAADAPGTMAAFGGLSEDNLQRILREPWVCCGTDETARPIDFSLGRSHPRGFGSFPRFFRMLREFAGIGEAVRRMTSLPAEIFHLHDRGRLVPGAAADMVLLDPETFCDMADFAEPHCRASGIRSVFVNGVLSYDGENVLNRAGRFLSV